MQTQARILVVDDDPGTRAFCVDALEMHGYAALAAASAQEAVNTLVHEIVDIVLTDLRMPDADGLELLKAVKREHPAVDVIVMTGYATIGTAVEAIKLGASEYLTKPLDLNALTILIRRLVERRELEAENRRLRAELKASPGFAGMIGRSAQMRRIYENIVKFAPLRQPVLIVGESGTGKELVARAIHESGPRREAGFIQVDCAALSPSLIESELFGHVRGAFTGAERDRRGLLFSPADATILLDEIGELPLETQAKLLRVLQEREFRPVGGNETVPLRGRIIAATNRNLEAAVKDGKFRSDLYYRLNVLLLKLPPLRERKIDIPLLAQHLLERHRPENSPIEGLSANALEALLNHDWPGNVRELENYVQRAIATGAGPILAVHDLPIELLRGAGNGEAAHHWGYLQEIERRAIIEGLEASGWHKARAAAFLGISKSGLYRKLKEYGLERSEEEQEGA